MDNLYALVLAAGEGKRMQSALPKVLHPLCGKPMIEYIIESAAELTKNVFIVVGHGALQVKETLGGTWQYVLQEEQLGTGHAVMQAEGQLPDKGQLLVLCGDTPLLKAEDLRQMVKLQNNRSAVVATTRLPDPAGYGRVIRDDKDSVIKIVEERDASEKIKRVDEINTGTYCFDLSLLKKHLHYLSTENAQNEYYLTDLLSLFRSDGYAAGIYSISDYRVGLGINNRAQLAEAERILRSRINQQLMLSGVSMVDPDATYIDQGVQIGRDTLILPGTVIERGSLIGAGCTIGPHTYISGSKIGDGAAVRLSRIVNSTIKDRQQVGPYSFINST